MTTEFSTPGKPGATGVTRLVKAAGYSARGLQAAFICEAAFRQELFVAVAGTALLPFLDVPLMAKLAMWAALMLLLVVELLNSAIEAVVDRVGAEHHALSGRAKDMGSAAVLICLLLCAGVWGCVLLHYL